MKRFSKSIFLTILVIAMAVALVGCKSSAKVEELEPAPAAEPAAPAAEPAAPAAEPAAPAAEPEAPAAEPAAEEAAEAWTITFYGYEAKIVYADKVATITYPSFVTNEEAYAAAAAAYAMYPAYFEGTTIEADNGVAYLTFPVDVSSEDLDAAVALFAEVLPAYVDSVLFPAIERTVEVYGFEVSVSYKDKVAKITYPATITKAEVAEAARTAYNAFEKYLQGTELSIGEGEAYLTFPVAITEDDIDYAVAMLSAYLPEYIEAVLAQAQAEEVAVVAEEPAAAPAEEAPAAAPAQEAPAASSSTTTSSTSSSSTTSSSTSSSSTTSSSTSSSSTSSSSSTTSAPAASSTTSTPASTASSAASAAQAQVAKKSNVGLIIVIIVLIIAAGAAVAIILKKKKG